MKLTVDSAVLAALVAKASRATGNNLPAYRCALLRLAGHTLTVSCTDGEWRIDATATVEGGEDGTTSVPVRLLGDIAASVAKGSMTLASDDDGLHIAAGGASFTLSTFATDEFPAAATIDAEPAEMAAAAFLAALRRCVPAASTDTQRPILCGVLLETEGDHLRIVATDSYRLHVADLAPTDGSPLLPDRHVVVPAGALANVVRLLGDTDTLTITLGGRMAVFAADDVTITTRLIEGEFLKYRGLIPATSPGSLSCDRAALAAAVKRVGVMVRDAQPIRLVAEDGGILVQAGRDGDNATDGLAGEWAGTHRWMNLNARFLVDVLNVCEGVAITAEFEDVRKPVVWRGDADDGQFLALLMQVRDT